MINKRLMENKLEEAQRIAEKYSLTSVVEELRNIHALSDEYRVHLLMIGGFSAGKSALLNRFIGKEVLMENLAPETALAAELYFSERERIVANFFDGSKREVFDVGGLNAQEVKNLEYYLNSERLKKHPDYIMVDTPGFDSGIEQHNNALMQYINHATGFFLVIDVEKGTISESALRFLNEVSQYSSDIAVIINKCDKKLPQDVLKIQEHVQSVLLASCGEEYPVICTSIKEEEVGMKLERLMNHFDPQILYEKNIGSMLNLKRDRILDALTLLKKTKELDTEALDREIENRESACETLLRQIEMKKLQVKNQLKYEVKERIIEKVQSELRSNVDYLTRSLQAGTESLQRAVIELIRPILIREVEEYSDIAYENLVQGLRLITVDESADIGKFAEIFTSIYEKVSVSQGIQDLFGSKTGSGENKWSVFKNAAGLLGIATKVVSPVVELIIYFLPEIFKGLRALFGKSKEEKMAEAIESQLIPEVISKLNRELDGSLSEVEQVLVGNISSSIQEIIRVEKEALENAKKKKTEMVEDFEAGLSEIDADIQRLGA